MYKYKVVKDSEGKVKHIETSLTGTALLNFPTLNKGNAFSFAERRAFGLLGKLPDYVSTLEEQVENCYIQYCNIQNDLARHIYLTSLLDRNEVLFYKLVNKYLIEMLPIVYTPTVGLAVEKYSSEFRRPRGLYIAYPDQEYMDEILENSTNHEVDLILVTDGEGVLGIGDQGIGGMAISVGKLMVYTLCAGIDPKRVLPVQLDVGTNNEQLLNDPLYLGWRHTRISGKEYDDFIARFIAMVQRKFPNAYVHWEDLGKENAQRVLKQYRDKICTFNDDMQGTGAVTLAGLLSAMKALDQKISEQRIVIHGAGTAATGIAEQIMDAMMREGLTEEQARSRFWLLGRHGLLRAESTTIADFQRSFARSREQLADWEIENPDMISLYDVVKNVKPTILIGCSTATGAFNEAVVKEMYKHTSHPIIFPLSNPTSKSEAHPKDLIEWTDGNALIATGSPFAPIEYKNRTYVISQSNNAYIFPGLGLGVIAAKAHRVTDGMIWAACDKLSECAPISDDKFAPLLPPLTEVQEISKKIALAVALKAREEGVAQVSAEVDLAKAVEENFWQPEYHPFVRVD